jgi:hypothetical protein
MIDGDGSDPPDLFAPFKECSGFSGNEASPQLSPSPRVARVSQRPLFERAIRPVDRSSERNVFEAAMSVRRFSEPLTNVAKTLIRQT